MPHCILEYSSNVVETPNLERLFEELHRRLAATGHFKLNDIKSRAIKHDCFCIGDGDSNRAFVTLEICILSGRDSATKRTIAEPAAALLQDTYAETLKARRCSLTVRVSDIDRESYRRIVSE